MNETAHRYALGSLAGLIATIPMTAVMQLGHQQLPEEDRYSLPPRKITMEMASTAGLAEGMSEAGRQELTLANHFAYGSGVGGLYGLIAGSPPAVSPALTGAAFGLSVWAASYLGWLPATGIYPSATREPASRNALMIAAHVVWGASLGMFTEGLIRSQGFRRQGPGKR